MQVVITTGAIKHAKLQSDCYHQQTNIQLFYRPDALPVAQPTVSEHEVGMMYKCNCIISMLYKHVD